MKLFIESVFDKETNKIEDVRKAAIAAANKLEASHGNNIVGKIYYFSIPLNKLIMVVGDIGKKVLDIDSNIILEKPIPEIKLGDIPTKMARYQELLIPQLDLKEKKVLFTNIKQAGGEEKFEGTLNLTEVASNNPVYDFQGYKVEIIDEQA